MAHDIDQQSGEEERLRESEERYRLLFQSQPSGYGARKPIADVIGGGAIGLLFVLHEYQRTSGIIPSRLK